MLSRKVKQIYTYASQINVVKMNRIFTVKFSWILTSFFKCWKITKKNPPLPLNLIPSKYPKPINSKCIQYYCTSYLFHPPPLRNEKKIINAYLHHQSSSSSTATPFFDNTGTTGNYCWSTIITNKFMLKTPLQIFTTCSILFKHHFIPTIIKT